MKKLNLLFHRLKRRLPSYKFHNSPDFKRSAPIIFLIFLVSLSTYFALSYFSTPRAPKLKDGKDNILYVASNKTFSTTIGTKDGESKISFAVGDSRASFVLAGSSKVAPKKDKNNSVVFPSVRDATDIRYTTMPNGLKEDIVLHKKPEKNILLFDLLLNNALPKKITNEFLDHTFKDSRGNYLFHFEKPYAIDANGNRTNNVILQIGEDKQIGGKYYMKLIIDPSWLADPSRIYPITIDPTIIHDTTAEFAAGQLNRLKDTGSGSTPTLETYYQELPTDQYTVGLWHFNESSGNALDSSGNSYTATATGTTVTSGLLNNGRSFNGTSDYFSCTDAACGGVGKLDIGTNSLSIEVWVKTTKSTRQIFAGKGTGTGQYEYSLESGAGSDGKPYFYLFNTVDGAYTAATAAVAINDNYWHHIAGTYDGTTISIYVDGVLSHSTTTKSGTQVTDSTSNFEIGARNTNTLMFSGTMDDLRISKVARTAEEIKMSASRRPYSVYTSDVIDYSAGITTWNPLTWTEAGVNTGDGETLKSTSGLIAQWNFNSTSGTTATNDAGSCGATCNGTLSGFDSTASQDANSTSTWTSNNKRWGAGALQFDGTDSVVTVTNNASIAQTGAELTVEAWFNVSEYSGTADGGVGRATGVSPYGGYLLAPSGSSSPGKFSFGVANSTTWQTVNTPTNKLTGVWYYVVGTYNATSGVAKIYVNGKEEGSVAVTGNIRDNSTNLLIGQNQSNYFKGMIDSVRIYSRALDAREIMSNYQAGNIEFQTRVGSDTSPDDGSWEAWKSTTGETAIDSLDTSVDTWTIDDYQNSPSTINKVGAINTGTGNDGACIMDNGTKTLDSTVGSSVCNGSARSTAYAVNFSVTGNTTAGSTSVTVSSTPTGIVAGDEFLIINLQGTSTNYETVGRYETHIVSSVSSNTLNFTDYPLKYRYDGTTQKIMVQRVPNFSSVTICGGNTGSGCTASATLTTSAWNGTKNGVLFFRSTGATTINSGGVITATGTGYRGGSGVLSSAGYQGESYNGTGSQTNTQNGGGGGGGNCYSSGAAWGTPGAGGGYGTPGSNSRGDTNCISWVGYGGNRYSISNSNQIMMGSGGGAGMSAAGAVAASGGAGGGILLISSSSLSLSGTITSNGGAGGQGTDNSRGNGGGGSGGFVGIKAQSLTLGSNLTTSSGGLGGNGVTNMYDGGNGGYGYVSIYYSSSISGTTTPSAYVGKLQTTIKSEGSGAMQMQTSRPEIDSGTVGLWHLDETSGSSAYLKDSTVNAYNGTPTGTTAVNGVSGKGRSFNGSGDKIVIGDVLDFSGDFSIEAWVKNTASSGTTQAIVDKAGTSGSHGYQLVVLNTGPANLTVINTANGNYLTASTTTNIVADNKWHHVVGTVSGTTISIYLDGALQASNSTTTGTRVTNSPDSLTIGDRNSSSVLDFNGQIDEVRISNVARTAEEIAESYRAGRDHYLNKTISSTDLSGKSSLPFYVAADRPGTYLSATIGESAYANYQPDSSTVGLWHLDEQSGSGAYIKDISGNTNHGTPTGTTFTQGKIGKARTFNGSSDYLNTGSTLNLSGSSFTIDAWARRTATGAYHAIVGQGTATTNGDLFVGFRNTNVFICSFYANDLDTTTTYTDSNWHHWACTYDTTTNSRKIYQDGVLVTSDTAANDFSGTGQFNIGAGYSSPNNYFAGQLDEVRVSNVARTATEIRQAYESGLRTHPITIDFSSAISHSDPLSSSSDLTFTLMATPSGTTNAGDNIYKGDKIIVKENYNGTEYLAQGTVDSVNVSTGATTVASWDSGSTFPSVGFGPNSTVFKWQREYWNINNEVLDTFVDGITNLTLRLTDGGEGRNIWLDDLRSNSDYLTNPSGSTITSSIGNRYMQYRAILSSFDEAVSATLSAVTLDYTTNSAPSTPTLDVPANAASNQILSTVLKTTASDTDSDYLRYKIELCTNLAMTTGCQTFDQTSSQTGWSGQNAQTSTAYTSSTQATYTIQTPLSAATTYYWRSYAIDPAGSNNWSSTQTPNSFTTTTAPSSPTTPYAEGSANPTGVIDTTPEFSAIHNDPNSDAANYYEIEVNTASDFTGTVMWDTGAVSMSALASGVRSADVSYAGTSIPLDGAGTTYYWRIRFTDVGGAVGAWSATQSFTMNLKPATPTLDLPINGITGQIFNPAIKTTTSDTDSDYLRYKIELCTNLAMTTGCQTFDQTSSQTGWSGQNAQTSTAYTSGTQATYTIQTPLSAATTYYWRSYSIDPGGSNTWGNAQSSPYSFTTQNAPEVASNCRIAENNTDTALNVLWSDNAASEDKYEVQRSVDGGGFSVIATNLAANTTNYLDSTISQGHTYQYRVAPYFSAGPVYSSWCTTSTLNLQSGIFKLNKLNFTGINFN